MTKEEIIRFIKKELKRYTHDKESYLSMVKDDVYIMDIDEANRHYRWYLEVTEVCNELDYILDHITKGDKEDGKDQD